MTQDQALNILKTGANVFLTGEPGAGKTHTVNAYVDYLRTCEIEPSITASTGIAATHIGGMTIHSWSGIGIKSRLDPYDLDKIATSEYISKRVRKTKVLIIDEISMLPPNTLDMVDMVCREIKQNGEPFGGIQVVLVGDFFQLPPIFKKETIERKQNSLLVEEKIRAGNFAYDSSAWERSKFITCYLSEQYRQDDTNFLSVLNAIRQDNFDEEHMDHISTRQIVIDDMPDNVTKLFSHNVDVDRVNNTELAKLGGESHVFAMISTGNDKLVEVIKKGCLSPEKLELKIGAVVMCTKNNQKEKYVNGTLGVVIGFEEFSGNPIIETRGGEEITISPMDWVVEENGKIRAQISQVPLRLAWAITVHKSQGMSLDAAVMDLSQVFEYGQGYVALSRVRRLSGLYLLGINAQALKVHPEILEQDVEFKRSSKEAGEFFANMPEKEIKKLHENFILACGGKTGKVKKIKKGSTSSSSGSSQAKPFAKIRETYPNAYKPWNEGQDEELKKLFEVDKSIKNLCEITGRQPGGIRARLKKLGLIEE